MSTYTMTNSSGAAQRLTLPQIVDKATDELLIGPDWSANMQFCDILNGNPAVAPEAIKLILKRIKDTKSVHVQILSLELLTTMVKNCFSTNSIVASKDFHSTILKLLEKKKLNENVKFKVVDMVQSFALSFKNTEWRNQFDSLYTNVRKLGIVFPPQGNESIFTPPPPPGYTQRYKENPQKLPDPQPTNTVPKSVVKNISTDTFYTAREAVQLLSEILSNVETKEELTDNEIATEMYNSCKEHQKKFQLVLEGIDVNNENQLEDLLQLNDQLVRVISRYDAAMKGEIYKPALLAVPREPLLEFFDDNSSPRGKNSQNTSQTPSLNNSQNTSQASRRTTSQPPQPTNSFFDDFVPQTSPQTTSSPSNTGGMVPLLDAPPASVKSRTMKNRSLTGQSSDQLQNQLEKLFINDPQPQVSTNPFTTNSPQEKPQNFTNWPFPNIFPQNPPPQSQFPNTTQTPTMTTGPQGPFPGPNPGPFVNPTFPPQMNGFPGSLPPYNPQLMPPQTGMQFIPSQPFPGNFPPQAFPYQYGPPQPFPGNFPPPPQFYYGQPPTGIPPINAQLGTQPPKANNSPNKPF